MSNSFTPISLTSRRQIELTRLQFAEATIRLESKPFSLALYPMFKQIYSVEYPELILKCGRQVGKTVTEHNMMLIESVAIEGFRHLYVSPSQEQTRRFSISKLGKTLHGSPDLKSILLSGNWRCNVSHHLYGNTSEIFLSYAGDDADRIRGISCDRIHYDEIQDIPYDGVVPVINECIRASHYKYITYAGTPKTLNNTIEYIWLRSTGNEWAIRCDHCNKWNIYVSLHGLGKKGISCLKCGNYVNPYSAIWVPASPNAHTHGFHIPQIILPENNPITSKSQKEYDYRLSNWQRILRKIDTGEYSETVFLNEVIGVSTAGGTKLFSLDELTEKCDPSFVMARDPGPHWNPNKYRMLIAGIDWGGNGKDETSRTALTIYALTYDGHMRLLYYRMYPIENPMVTLDDITHVLDTYNINVIGADAGEGSLPNSYLRRKYGHDKVFPIRYLKQKRILEWDNELHQGCYKVDKTSVIDNLSLYLKNNGGSMIYPRAEDCQPLFDDMLNVFEDITKAGNKVWAKHSRMTDDGLHAQVFAYIAMKVATGDMNWYTEAIS